MPKQQRALRTRAVLIRAAACIFEEQGYSRTTLSEVSRLAKTSTGALHFHFETKADLANAVEGAATRTLGRIGATVTPGGSSMLQQLVDATHALAVELRDDTVLRAGFRLSRDAWRNGEHQLHEYWYALVRDLLTAAKARGELAPYVSVGLAAYIVAGVTTSFELGGRRHAPWPTSRELAGCWQLLLPPLTHASTAGTVDPAGGAGRRASAGRAGAGEGRT